MFFNETQSHYHSQLEKQMNTWLYEYHTKSDSKDILDTIQWTLKCCGSTNGTGSAFANITVSCCDRTFTMDGLHCQHPQYLKPCTDALRLVVSNSLIIIMVVVIETLVAQWIALLASWYLAKEYKILELRAARRAENRPPPIISGFGVIR